MLFSSYFLLFPWLHRTCRWVEEEHHECTDCGAHHLSLAAHAEHCAATGHMHGQGLFPGDGPAPGEEVTVEELVEVAEEEVRMTRPCLYCGEAVWSGGEERHVRERHLHLAFQCRSAS